MDEIIKIVAGIFIVVVLICGLFFVLPPPAEKTPVPGSGSLVDGRVTVYFFYGEECPHCHVVLPLVQSLKEKYPGVDLRILEIWHNAENQALSNSLNNKLGAKNVGVPEVIIGNIILVGEKDIPANLESVIIGELKKTGTDGQVPTKAAPSSNTSATPV
ncbi:MAG: thioredoxin family protein [Methanoregula sp.]|jgi:thiol-disulfide isomerase/thioredoxin